MTMPGKTCLVTGATSGKMRDLVIGAKQLSGAALIKIAADGLST